MPNNNDTVYICPDCGSASVEFSGLIGGVASCKVCPWSGIREKLLAVPFINATGDQGGEQAVMAIRSDVRRIIREDAPDFVKLLIRWGFVEATQKDGKVYVKNQQQVVRYMNAIANQVFIGMIEERKKIEVERVAGN